MQQIDFPTRLDLDSRKKICLFCNLIISLFILVISFGEKRAFKFVASKLPIYLEDIPSRSLNMKAEYSIRCLWDRTVSRLV